MEIRSIYASVEIKCKSEMFKLRTIIFITILSIILHFCLGNLILTGQVSHQAYMPGLVKNQWIYHILNSTAIALIYPLFIKSDQGCS